MSDKFCRYVVEVYELSLSFESEHFWETSIPPPVKTGERKVKENLIFTSELGFLLEHRPCAQLPGDERLKKKKSACKNDVSIN